MPYPVVLQARARAATRKHLLRSVCRRAGLLVMDVGALFPLKYALRALRDSAIFGESIQGVARVLLPKGTFYPYEFTAALVVGLLVTGNYKGGGGRRNGGSLLLGVTLGMAFISWGRFWSDVTLHGATSEFAVYSALGFVLSVCSVGSVVLVERHFFERIVGWLRPLSASTTRVLAVGPAVDCRRALARYVTNERALASVGFLNTDTHADPDAVGQTSDLVRVISRFRADAVLLCGDLDATLASDIMRIADSAACKVLATHRLTNRAGLRPQSARLNGLPIVQLTRPSLRSGQLAIKSVLDVTLAGLGLIVLSPLFLAIAAVVRLSSRGPVVFKQIRVGQCGRPFAMYKFRSMVADAEGRRGEVAGQNIYGDGRLFKMDRDPRITRVGRILRQTSLDELPQLWNVVRGDMSLVGPRPPMFTELALYEEHDYVRFEMKPGVTGPWQVSGRNTITDFDEVVELETEYMRGWHPWRDVAILLRTIPAVLTRSGAL